MLDFRRIGDLSPVIPHPVLQLHSARLFSGDHHSRGHLHGRSQGGEADVEDKE